MTINHEAALGIASLYARQQYPEDIEPDVVFISKCYVAQQPMLAALKAVAEVADKLDLRNTEHPQVKQLNATLHALAQVKP